MKKLIVSLVSLTSLLASACYAQVATNDVVGSLNLRNAFQVSYDDVEEAVATTLHQNGLTEKLKVTMTGHKEISIFSYEKPVSVEVKGLKFAKLDNRWTASLLFVSNNEVISAIPASGHFDEIVELPVLKSSVRAGDIISENDLEIRDFSIGHTRNDTITDLSELIGKTPLHNLSPSRPIKHQEVSIPSIIKKTNIVEMRYNSPGMQISTSGEAMMDGAKGDVINVKNSTSKKIVRAVVADNKTVNIVSPEMETSQLVKE